MARRPAQITQADIARAIRAAKQAGAVSIEVVMADQAKIIVRIAPVFDEKPLPPEPGEIVL
jgi:hypothetical protein